MERPHKKYPTIACCGLDCGLCPRYYTKGVSRCPGCAGPDFFNQHPSCSFITCCVKKMNLEVCGQCSEFPCPKFKTEEEYRRVKESSSYPSYSRVMSNSRCIRDHGIVPFIKQQKKRMKWLGVMLKGFDDGRSRSFFCRAAGLLDISDLEESCKEASRTIKADRIRDIKGKAGILREILSRKLSSRDSA